MLAPTVVELKEPALVQQVTQLATSQRRQPEDLVAVAVRDYLEGLEEMAIHKETEAFWQQHEELVQNGLNNSLVYVSRGLPW